jgi:hypothetical protein
MMIMREGGWTMWVIITLLPAALALSILHAAVARAWSGMVAVGVVALVLLVGGFGTMHGRTLTEQAIGGIEDRGDGMKAEIMAQGYREASRPFQFALGVAGLCAIPLVVGQIRKRARNTI